MRSKLFVLGCLLFPFFVNAQCSKQQLLANCIDIWLNDTVRPVPSTEIIYLYKDSLTSLIAHPRIVLVDIEDLFKYSKRTSGVEFYCLEFTNCNAENFGVHFQPFNAQIYCDEEECLLLALPGFREQIWQPDFLVECKDHAPVYWGSESYSASCSKIMHQSLDGFTLQILQRKPIHRTEL